MGVMNTTTQPKYKFWWIRSRFNPQLNTTLYFAYGNRSEREMRPKSQTAYGSVRLLRFESAEEYAAKVAELEAAGHQVRTDYPI
jgi:hypothetical protein